MNKVWILGWLEKIEYFKKAIYCIKGEEDPDRYGWRFTDDCWNCYIQDLNKVSNLETMILTEDHSDWNKVNEEIRRITEPKKIEAHIRKDKRIQKEKDDHSKKLSKMKDDWFDEEAKRQIISENVYDELKKTYTDEEIAKSFIFEGQSLTEEELKQFSDMIKKMKDENNNR
jgi:hypothetical protein